MSAHATIVPPRLRSGDTVRVIAPARSRAMVMEHDNTRWIDERFAAMGLTLTFGEHVDEDDQFRSSSIEHRVADLHAAFADPSVAGILTVIGGFNSNELLPYLDFDLIAAHPKVFCGYSDITALQNAILARTGLITYSGPHWSSWGMRDHFEPTGDWFRAAVTDDAPIAVEPSAAWTDDLWFLDQDARTPVTNEGWWRLRPGQASGRIVGGNLCTLNLLQGTANMPSLDGALLFVEDDFESNTVAFARNLTSLLQLPDAAGVTGLVVGRFQAATGMTRAALDEIVARQPALAGKPVLAGVDLGHTSPLLTIPVGGTADVVVGPDDASLTITSH
ncbi:S66 peptidase family protein [Promicromonospora sp. NPDC059942]|uniref:S66 family peptidase n=1 Tax=Promicromonospora sp. NPDC059942 TaxID=3347009 RepID=UPI00364CE7BE